MKIAIVGWGVEGQSAYKFFGPNHDYLIVSEEPRDDFPPESDKVKVRYLSVPRPAGVPSNVKDLGYMEGIENCDKIIYQPTGLHNLKERFGDDEKFWQKATTVNHIFFENAKSRNIIGITGSKGKGTTSTLIAKVLEAQGKKVHLGGNIGNSMLDLLPLVEPNDWVVLELANFQLKEFPYSPHVAVALMITEEHLDWHPDMDDYVEAKANLFKHQSSDDIAIYFANNEYSRKIASYSKGKKIPYYKAPGAHLRGDGMIVLGDEETKIMDKSEVKLLGEHNLQNICAALTAVFESTGSLDGAKEVLSSFSGLEHRLEFVRSLGGVKYYDDSYSTTPETAIVAMRAFKEPKIVILGGHDKALSFDKMANEVVKNTVKHAVLIGKTGPKIAQLLSQRGFTEITEGLTTMTEIVAEAKKHAQEGDVVLLSPGCSSYGLFRDYKDRGNQFKEAVKNLT